MAQKDNRRALSTEIFIPSWWQPQDGARGYLALAPRSLPPTQHPLYLGYIAHNRQMDLTNVKESQRIRVKDDFVVKGTQENRA